MINVKFLLKYILLVRKKKKIYAAVILNLSELAEQTFRGDNMHWGIQTVITHLLNNIDHFISMKFSFSFRVLAVMKIFCLKLQQIAFCEIWLHRKF